MSRGDMGSMAFQQPEAAPGLFTFLWEKYIEHRGDDGRDRKQDSCFDFINFCEDYLSKHRPTLTFVAHNNVGVYLGEKQRVLVAPPVSDVPTGEMAPTALPHQGAVMISGNAKKTPGTEDMSQYDKRTFESKGGKSVAATVQQKPEKLDQEGEFTRQRQ